MENLKISDDQIEMILSESFDSNFWLHQLGVIVSEGIPSNEKLHSFDFYNYGKLYWNDIKENLLNLLCDRNSKVPNPFLDELLNGDIRNLIVYLISFLVSNLDIVIAVAIPVVSLIIKEGVKNICLYS